MFRNIFYTATLVTLGMVVLTLKGKDLTITARSATSSTATPISNG